MLLEATLVAEISKICRSYLFVWSHANNRIACCNKSLWNRDFCPNDRVPREFWSQKEVPVEWHDVRTCLCRKRRVSSACPIPGSNPNYLQFPRETANSPQGKHKLPPWSQEGRTCVKRPSFSSTVETPMLLATSNGTRFSGPEVVNLPRRGMDVQSSVTNTVYCIRQVWNGSNGYG
jgi:hypothetical protein